MNLEHPEDYAPLSYGTALAMGLMLLVGLPAEKPRAPAKPADSPPVPDAPASAFPPTVRDARLA